MLFDDFITAWSHLVPLETGFTRSVSCLSMVHYLSLLNLCLPLRLNVKDCLGNTLWSFRGFIDSDSLTHMCL